MSSFNNYNNYNNKQRGNNDKYDRKPRFKGIKGNDRSHMSLQESEEKFNYTKLASDLLEKEDIWCSEEVINDACDTFDKMGGEDGLKEDLLLGIISFGYLEPSRIQSYAIPQIIKRRDILAQSQSGTGKTGAFLISALELIDENINAPQAIILSPTAELATQTYIVGKSLSVRMPNVKFSFTVGGSDTSNNIRELGGVHQGKTDEKAAQIIIATPGRLIHILKEYPHLFEQIKLLIIDECDELLSGSFKEEIKKILEGLSENVQICLFSATLNNDVVVLANVILNKPVQILIKKEKMTLDGIKQTYIDIINPDDKLKILIDMLQTIQVQQFIVYVNTKSAADILKTFLEKDYNVLTITSSMSKYDRADIIRKFKQGGYKCLISTDLLSRGIDIQQLSLVINYDLPRSDNIQCYIHRIGRTGRYGKSGLAINLVTKYEKDIQNLISLTFKCPILPLNPDFLKDM
jgi:translation initiation factor 4A